MNDMSIELAGGELTDAEMAKLMETGIECEEQTSIELFVCPACGGSHCGRDVERDANGRPVALNTMRCHDEFGSGCNWHGKWPQDNSETELINPVTGAIVNLDDIDSLILGCDECKKIIDDVTTFYRTLREAAWAKTEGTTKTRRLKGKKYQAKVEQGDRSPVGAILKEAWNSYPQFREKYLRIGKVDPQMREVAKLKGMASDDPAFVQFKGMIEDALTKGTEGLPTVSLEHGENE